MKYTRAGLLYHPRDPSALALSEMLRDTVLNSLRGTWLAETGDEATVARHIGSTDLLVCIGGDGTVLWAARTAAPHPVPIVSINKGRLGFLSELNVDDAPATLAAVLDGAGFIEERAMVECELQTGGDSTARPLIGLNDIVVGRAAPGRPVYLSIAVDGVHLARIRGDAMIVSTATGSTAYNLSAGGPVLMPQSRELLLTPVAPHLSRMRPIVLPPESMVEIRVEGEHGAVVSIDGQVDQPLTNGCSVATKLSQQVARFVRLGPPSDFFQKLAQHLNLSTQREE